MIVLASLVVLAVVFAALAFAMGIIASQCVSAIQGTDAWKRILESLVKTKPSMFVPSMGGDGHPMDTRLWFALQQAQDLPPAVEAKAKTIGRLYELERLVFAGFVVAILIAGIGGQ